MPGTMSARLSARAIIETPTPGNQGRSRRSVVPILWRAVRKRVTNNKQVGETMILKAVDPDTIMLVHDAAKKHNIDWARRIPVDLAGVAIDDIIHGSIDVAAGTKIVPTSVAKITHVVDALILADKAIMAAIGMLSGDV